MLLKPDKKLYINKCSFGRCLINLTGVIENERVNIYTNSNYNSITILKLSQESKLLNEEEMFLLYKNIYFLHADDCPMMIFNRSLDDNKLQIDQNELKVSLKFASVGIIQDKEDYLLLTKRHRNLSIFPKAWVFPGGKVDDGESFIQACIREIKEEVGIDLKFQNDKYYFRNTLAEVEPIISYESIYPNKLSQGLPKAQTFIIFFLIRLNEIKENIYITPEPKEVEGYTWVHKKDLNDILFNSKENITFEGFSLSKKNVFEKKIFSSFNLANYSQGDGEGIPYGHYLALKYLMNKYSYKSNF